MEFLVLRVPWLGSLCQKGTPKNRLLDLPVYILYNHILQYITQKRESQHPYTTFAPSHCAPTEPSRNITTPSQSKQSWPPPKYGAFRYHPTPHFSPRLPFSGSAGSRRSRFIQQSAVRSGPARHARPSHATGRLGADSPNNRNATVAPRGGRETFIIDRVYTANFKEFGSLVCLWHDVKLRKTRLEIRSLNVTWRLTFGVIGSSFFMEMCCLCV